VIISFSTCLVVWVGKEVQWKVTKKFRRKGREGMKEMYPLNLYLDYVHTS